jgi:uncharacterized membrane protein YbhN (UPF0104 family)
MLPSFASQIAALALCGADILVRGIRLRLLVPASPGLSLRRAIAINAYGDAAAAVTPARLGGDAARFVGFRRAGIDTPRALAGIAVETLIDWLLLAAAVVILGLALGETAVAGARHLLALATGPRARLLVGAVLTLAVASAAAASWYRRRFPSISLAPAWRRAGQLGWSTVLRAGILTAISMTLRTAILPVLAAGHAGSLASPGSVILGSFALLYGQLLLPTPAGAGAVELGFVAGFAGTLSAPALAALLAAWRVYTLIVPAALGGLLFARAALQARAPAGRDSRSRATSPRYSSSSSEKVRSQP